MIELSITGVQRKEARKLYRFHDLNNSITKGKSQIYGAMGEVLVSDYFTRKGYSVSFHSCFDYDMIVAKNKIEVKSKKTTVTPVPEYECHIPAYNIHQKCDYFYFVRILESLKKGWILGYCRREEFFRSATLKKSGQKGEFGFQYKCDSYILAIDQLTPVTLHL